MRGPSARRPGDTNEMSNPIYLQKKSRKSELKPAERGVGGVPLLKGCRRVSHGWIIFVDNQIKNSKTNLLRDSQSHSTLLKLIHNLFKVIPTFDIRIEHIEGRSARR